MNKPDFKPFADDSASLDQDGLTFENQGDAMSLYGSVDLTLDQDGLAKALRLKQLVDQAVTFMQTRPLPERLPAARTGNMRNPFT